MISSTPLICHVAAKIAKLRVPHLSGIVRPFNDLSEESFVVKPVPSDLPARCLVAQVLGAPGSMQPTKAPDW